MSAVDHRVELLGGGVARFHLARTIHHVLLQASFWVARHHSQILAAGAVGFLVVAAVALIQGLAVVEAASLPIFSMQTAKTLQCTILGSCQTWYLLILGVDLFFIPLIVLPLVEYATDLLVLCTLDLHAPRHTSVPLV